MPGRHARPSRADVRAGVFAGADRQSRTTGAVARKRARLWRRARGATVGAALTSGALILGVLGGGSTFALWNDSATVDGGVIHVPAEGTVAMQFAVGSPTAAAVNFTNLLPNESKTAIVQLENTGEVDLDIDATLTATTGSGYTLRLLIDAACTNSGFLPSPYLTTAALAPSSPQAVGSIDTGDTVALCVQVTAASNITPSSSATFTVSLVGDSGS